MTDHPHPHPPHSRRPAEVWDTARADYEAGCSIRIVAERHGLNIRTVSRHAREGRWQAPSIPAAEAFAEAIGKRRYRPSAFDENLTVNHVVERDAEDLLLCPDSVSLCQFAFRRAAESASVAGPTEALAWIRLAEATARLRSRVDIDIRPMSQADYRRVAALAGEESDAFLAAVQAAGPDPEVQSDQVTESVPRNSSDTDTWP